MKSKPWGVDKELLTTSWQYRQASKIHEENLEFHTGPWNRIKYLNAAIIWFDVHTVFKHMKGLYQKSPGNKKVKGPWAIHTNWNLCLHSVKGTGWHRAILFFFFWWELKILTYTMLCKSLENDYKANHCQTMPGSIQTP